MKNIIVGISGSHDASACVLVNGNLKKAIQLERLSRIKREGFGFLHSEEGIKYCLKALGLKESDVDYFAFNNQPLLPKYCGLSQPINDSSFQIFDPYGEKSIFVSHHLAHAFSAFFASPYEYSTVFVCDGSGGSTLGKDDIIFKGCELKEYLEKEMIERPLLHVESSYTFDRNGFKLIDRVKAPSFNVRCGSSSLGETYAAVSQYIFKNWQDGGKLMGLAPYGNPEKYGPSLLVKDKNGLLQFTDSWKLNYNEVLTKKDVMEYCNLAARVQKDLETALLQRMDILHKKAPSPNLCYAGGVALNCVANNKIKNFSKFNNMYVFPASNDAGISVGAAAAAYYQLTGKTKGCEVKSMFLGREYNTQEIDFDCKNFERYISKKRVSTDEIAQELQKGKIFGLFDGPAEFGPRALGHRSIIASPRLKETWQFINRKIKFREDFRPFAPAVAEEDAHKYFEIKNQSRYMLQTVDVKQEHRKNLAAVTHVDGSARVQTVDKNQLPFFHSLLKIFEAYSDYPILINTSFNVRGQPIVETPKEALEVLLSTYLDGVLFQNNLVYIPSIEESEINMESIPTLTPCVQLHHKRDFLEEKFTLKVSFRRDEISLKNWQYELLLLIDGNTPINTLVSTFSNILKNEIILEWLISLFRDRLLYFFSGKPK